MYFNSENSHAFIYAFFKNNKTKKNKFYVFINAFFFKKKNNIKKAKITHAFSFKKFITFHAFINAFLKNKNKKEEQNQKDKKNSCIQGCIFIQNNSQSFKHS